MMGVWEMIAMVSGFAAILWVPLFTLFPTKLATAHRNLDMGVPIKDSEWGGIDRSLYIFYGVPLLLMIVFAISISIWGWQSEPERRAAHAASCEARGMQMQETSIARRCVPR